MPSYVERKSVIIRLRIGMQKEITIKRRRQIYEKDENDRAEHD